MYVFRSVLVRMNLHRECLVERQDFEQEWNPSVFQAEPLDDGFSDEFWVGCEML
jgi:hypothetical protein